MRRKFACHQNFSCYSALGILSPTGRHSGIATQASQTGDHTQSSARFPQSLGGKASNRRPALVWLPPSLCCEAHHSTSLIFPAWVMRQPTHFAHQEGTHINLCLYHTHWAACSQRLLPHSIYRHQIHTVSLVRGGGPCFTHLPTCVLHPAQIWEAFSTPGPSKSTQALH